MFYIVYFIIVFIYLFFRYSDKGNVEITLVRVCAAYTGEKKSLPDGNNAQCAVQPLMSR